MIVSLSGCGADPTPTTPASTPAPPPIPAPIAAPGATTPFEELVIEVGSSPVTADLSTGFSGVVAEWSALSSDPAIVTVSVTGTLAEITPVAVGTASIAITARNAGGAAEQTLTVTVVPAPETGTLGPVFLSPRGSAAVVDVSGAFTGTLVTVTARALDPQVASVSVNGTVVTIAPLSAGSTSVEVTVRTAYASVPRKRSR